MSDQPEVGRLLDEAVFREVYGFVRWPQGDRGGEEAYLNFAATPEAGEVWYGAPPAYSADMDEAWCLAEAIREGDDARAKALLTVAICRVALEALEEKYDG
jgi:hypothetical protein